MDIQDSAGISSVDRDYNDRDSVVKEDDPGRNYSRSPSPLDPAPISLLQQSIPFVRFGSFFLMEVLFVTLAIYCLFNPLVISLPVDATASEARGGFTVIFIVWQTIAIWLGGGILSDTFSKEWSFHYRKTGKLTDRVSTMSTLSAGLPKQLTYSLSKHSSRAFKLAFAGSIALMALSSFAPGTISVTNILHDKPMSVQVGVPPISSALQAAQSPARANLITRLEKIEKSSFGYSLKPNWLMGWPRGFDVKPNGTLTYPTDVVQFQHECHWEAPQFPLQVDDSALSSSPFIIAAGQKWATNGLVTEVISRNQSHSGSAIAPLVPYDYILGTSPVTNLSAYIFLGGNDTSFMRQPGTGTPVLYPINLEGLPTYYSASGIAGKDLGSGGQPVAPLASLLICDPHIQISGGSATLSPDNSLVVSSSGLLPIGNIPSAAANIIFSQGLYEATQMQETEEDANFVNYIAASMFMSTPAIDWNVAEGILPLSISTINNNLDAFMLSASKAYMDGFRANTSLPVGDFSVLSVDATGQVYVLALVTSKSLLIVTVVIILATSGIILALGIVTHQKHEYLMLFTLQNIRKTIWENPTEVPDRGPGDEKA